MVVEDLGRARGAPADDATGEGGEEGGKEPRRGISPKIALICDMPFVEP